jgi:1-deoxy-D-xylulose-5-phosphate synthase
VITVEEGQVGNGFGAFMTREMDALDLAHRPRVACMGIPDQFVEHGARGALLAALGLDAPGIASNVRALCGARASGAVP